MFARLRAAQLIWLSISACIAFVILVGLGYWQWQRKGWKDALLETLQSSAVTQPVEFSSIVGSKDLRRYELHRVALHGRFEHDFEFHVWSPRENGVFWRVITVLALTVPPSARQQSPNYVLVIRGEVDADHKLAESRQSGQVPIAHKMIGRIRFGSSNWSTPQPNLVVNEWYGLDLEKMRAKASELIESTVKSSGAKLNDVRFAPFFVEAETAIAPPPAPQPSLRRLALHNRHLAYALTWWSLAATLVGVYVAFAAVRLRATKATT